MKNRDKNARKQNGEDELLFSEVGTPNTDASLLKDVESEWNQLSQDSKKNTKAASRELPKKTKREAPKKTENQQRNMRDSKNTNSHSNSERFEKSQEFKGKNFSKDKDFSKKDFSKKDFSKKDFSKKDFSKSKDFSGHKKDFSGHNSGHNSKSHGENYKDRSETTENPISNPKQLEKINSLVHPGELVLDTHPWWSYEGNAGTQVAPADLTTTLKFKAKSLLDAENRLYETIRKSDRDYSSSLDFLKGGTFSDQLGTLSLMITEDPLHSVRLLEMLIGKCEVKNRESACKALEVTKDLLISHVLPDRRLVRFVDQPLCLDADIGYLVTWAFEDWLKNAFFKVLQVMERLLADTVESIRIRTLHCVFSFLKGKPEQEANLLKLGVNKLGDKSGKVASRVKKLLNDCFQAHPGFKSIAASAISEVIDRSPEHRVRYYAIDTLSEFILSNNDTHLPNQLVFIYLNLFEQILALTSKATEEETEKNAPVSHFKGKKKAKRGKKGGLRQQQKTVSQKEEDQNDRLTAKIFTGLNRAFPFSALDPSVFEKYMDTLFRMAHSSNIGTLIEALSFIFLTIKNQYGQGNDRFYRTLYDSLLDPRLYTSAKLAKFLHLILKALSSDTDTSRGCAFAKRLVQVANHWPEIGACASLLHIVSYVSGREALLQPFSGEDKYDLKSRDPRFAEASTSRLWELTTLMTHYHPTVALYAENLMENNSTAKLNMPDIEQYSVSSFLDKWSYKKPKEKESTRGGSIFQPLGGFTDLKLGIRQQRNASNVPVPLREWGTSSKTNLAPDELFYHEFFSNRPARQPKPEKAAKPENSEDEEDLEEDAVFNAIMKSNPDEAPSDDDSIGSFGDMSDGESGDEKDLEDLEDSPGEDFSFDEGDLSEDEEAASEGEDEEEDKDDKDKAKSRKRKRAWDGMPMFMDADAFETAYKKKAKD